MAHESLLGILFSGSRSGMLALRLEKRLKDYIFELHPDYRSDLEKNVVLTYLIHGAYHTYVQYSGEDHKTVLLMINTMASAVLRMYTRPAEEGSAEAAPAQPEHAAEV